MASKSTSTPEPTATSQGLSGVRGEFVASLGKKVRDAKTTLARTRAATDPSLADLTRRLTVLAKSARQFRFDAMAETLSSLIARLPTYCFDGDEREIASVLDRLPDLAWTTTPSRLPSAVAISEAEAVSPEQTIVADGAEASEPPSEVEVAAGDEVVPASDEVVPASDEVVLASNEAVAASDEASSAPLPPADLLAIGSFPLAALPFTSHELASFRALVDAAHRNPPAAILLDADCDDMDLALEAWLDDPKVEAIPAVVVGTFASRGDASRFIALGAAETLGRPITSSALATVLSRFVAPALSELEAYVNPSDANDASDITSVDGTRVSTEADEGVEQASVSAEVLEEAYGEPDAAREDRAILGAEAEGGFLDASAGEVPLESAPVEGDEQADSMLGDISSTISRIRALLDRPMPQPSIVLAMEPGEGTRGGVRKADASISLSGRCIVVADHDPAIVWFIADVLRREGAFVVEAKDGPSTIEAAMKHAPDLVLADMLLSGTDGIEVARSLKSDIALRDVPILMLSWKDDLPRRARELGAVVDGFLRKESNDGVILARVREALFGRARLEGRLGQKGSLKGRLDGLAPATLVRLVARYRETARLVVEDDLHSFELFLEKGTPVAAHRHGPSPLDGPAALAALLALRSARFAVLDGECVAKNLDGDLDAQLAPLVAKARGAVHALTGHRLFAIESIELDLEAVAAELATFPRSARSTVEAIANGASLRELLRIVDPAQLESVLTYLAWRGLVRGISLATEGSRGETLHGSGRRGASSSRTPFDSDLAMALSAFSPEPPHGERFLTTDVDAVYGLSSLSPSTAAVRTGGSDSSIPVVVEASGTPPAAEVAERIPAKKRGVARFVAPMALLATLLGVAASPPGRASIESAWNRQTAPVIVPAIEPATPIVPAVEVHPAPIAVPVESKGLENAVTNKPDASVEMNTVTTNGTSSRPTVETSDAGHAAP